MASTSRLDNDAVQVAPVIAVLLVLLKAYVVAKFSLTTAGALVVAAPFAVVVGSVTAYLNWFIVVAGAAALAFLVRHRRDDDRASQPFEGILVSLAILGVLFFPLPANDWSFERIVGTPIYVAWVAVLVWSCWKLSQQLSDRADSRSTRIARSAIRRPAWFMAVGVVAILLPTLRVPWVPAEVLVLREQVAISDSHPDETGTLVTTRYPVVFVVSEGTEWLTVLDADTRFLTRLPIGVVAHRQVCHHRDQPHSTIPLIARLTGSTYDSPNTMCHTLVDKHETLLDPLVLPAGQADD